VGDAAFTTGATVYVLGQAAKAIFVDPIMEQRKVIGEIAYNLMYLAPWYANPVVHDETPPEQREPYDKAADTLAEDEARQQAASLRQRARRLRLRAFGNLADELEAHAVALHETADAIVTQLEALLPPSA